MKSVTGLLILGGAVMATVSSAQAGYNHARCIIGLGISSQLSGDPNAADCQRNQGSKNRVAHESPGNNYTYGNAGSGHAHHHTTIFGPSELHTIGATEGKPMPPPKAGAKGTSQYIGQTWVAGGQQDTIVVSLTPDTFLQVDTTKLQPNETVTSGMSVSAGRVVDGTIELSAGRNGDGPPTTYVRATGALENASYTLVTDRRGRIVTLQFKTLPTWTVAGDVDTFDGELTGSIIDETAGK
jgi:hypothetical protein